MSKRFCLGATLLSIAISGAGLFAPVFSNSPPPDEDFKPWLELCRSRIINAGGQKIAEHAGEGKSVSCTFYVRKDGTAGDLAISSSSGDKQIDQAAIDSLNKAAPFPQCEISPIDRSILVIFDKNISLHHYQARLGK